MPVSYSGTAITWPDNSTTTSGWTGFKNRIINGAMMIDQRNAGASVTLGVVNPQYTLDRWAAQSSAASKMSIQQNAGSVTPPAGFTKYLGVTSLTAYSVGSGDYFSVRQAIEGLNIADLGWGTADAQPVTVSFKVRSSLTGTFGGSLCNDAFNRSYPFTYSVSAAITWETKTVTIPGDTTGTWLTTNGQGIIVTFGLGVGSTYSGTAGAWAASGYLTATGATSVVGTNGATFYITGVQLERGSTASSFEYRNYGTELNLCQRYFEKGYSITCCYGNGSNGVYSSVYFKVTKRATPTATVTGTDSEVNAAGSASLETAAGTASVEMMQAGRTSAPSTGFVRYGIFYTVSSEL